MSRPRAAHENWHKIAGLLYGISVMLLSLIMLIPSFEIIEVGQHLPRHIGCGCCLPHHQLADILEWLSQARRPQQLDCPRDDYCNFGWNSYCLVSMA